VCGLLSTPNIAESSNKYTITARRTYLETGRLATDDAVLNFLDALNAHKRQCEAEGKYMEARAAAKRISKLKMQEALRLRKEMLARQREEVQEADDAYEFEKEQQEAVWAEKVRKCEEDLAEAVARKKRSHMEQLEQFIAEMERKKPAMPKASKDLLIHRNIELHLAKQGQYTKATRVKDAADQMEIAEMESTLATFEAELSLKVRLTALQSNFSGDKCRDEP
jgi:Fe2+ transport system protein B